MPSLSARLDRFVDALPHAYPGPGGAIAVLQAGETLVRHAWGWADAERRIAFTPDTLFRMCSITKQFTCGLVLDAFADPSVLDGDVAARLPLLDQAAPGALHLCHNQSGLRDYWAVAMLHGAPAESAFGDEEAAAVIGGTRTLQFRPGTRYSYANQNFRILSDLLQDRTGRSFAELLRTRIFEPAGMHGAFLAADTSAMPDGTQGYEGSQSGGFRAAVNRILWTGDAGLGASLDDLIAWERRIDATRDDSGSLYDRLSAPVAFADGAPASYGFGLGRRMVSGHAVTGHGGALRGWRSHRLHAAGARVSVVILFNHLSDAGAAAEGALAALLDDDPPAPASCTAPDWLGAYIEPETGLTARIDGASGGRIRLRYGHAAEWLPLQTDGSAGADGTRLRPGEGGMWMDRPADNQRSLLRPCLGAAIQAPGIAGRYRCEELQAELTIEEAGGAFYAACGGVLGRGRMELLEPVGADVWTMPCWRALDHTPPGDWTLAFRRDGSGRATSIQLGCWLARNLAYTRIG